MTLIKICGITTVADGRAAIAAGADMLGFNFYGPSSRFIDPSSAKEIIQAVSVADRVTMVGVFVNEPSPEAVMQIVADSGVGAVQLHGDESVEYCQQLKQLMGGRLVIKVLRVTSSFDPADVRRYEVDAIMLDSFHRDVRGGTGQVFDWSVTRAARELGTRLFLAGGLSPENVAQAIAEVEPYAVDACSSLESAPGKKDLERIKAFVEAVRNG